MKTYTIAKKIQGASHIKNRKECQDSFLVQPIEYKGGQLTDICQEYLTREIIVAAAADGHGSEKCPFSKDGSRIATEVFQSEIFKIVKAAADSQELFSAFRKLDVFRFTKVVCEEWKHRVLQSYSQRGKEPVSEENVVEMFGTTLLGTVVTADFLFGFQIGDGDITYVDNNISERFVEQEKLLGTETYSLSNKDPFKTVKTRFQAIDNKEKEYMLLLTTDGFSNCYPDDQAFLFTCREYFDAIREYGAVKIQDQIKEWLRSMSEEASGDDITFIAVGKMAEKPEAMDTDKAVPAEEEIAEETTDGVVQETKTTNFLPEVSVDQEWIESQASQSKPVL